ncbi:MAG: MarR family transcriptional regulator [Hespellia sp.]|nr:MarR family transcriptional regulator [Hespellia sp.]
MKDQYVTCNDLSLYTNVLNNQIQKKMYSLYNRKQYDESSLLNMWIVDYLCNMQELEKEVHQKDIESEFRINRATASKTLKLMEKKQFIQRTNSVEDGRMKIISLLPRGIELQKLWITISSETEKQLMECITEKEKAAFVRISKKILAKLDNL